MTLVLFLLASIWILAFCVLGKTRYVRHWTNTLFPLVALIVVNTVVAAKGNFDVVDKMRYGLEFQALSFTPFRDALNAFVTDGREPAFLLFAWVIGLFTHDMMVFFVVTSVVCNLLLVLALWMILGTAWQTVIVVYATFCFGFFIDYSSFLLRQGLSMSCLLIGLALVVRHANLVWVAVVLVIGVCFHWSALAAAVVILVVRLVRFRSEVLLGLWVLLSITYFTGANQRVAELLGPSIEQVETYTDPDLAATYAGGTNRLDFWILSAVPLAVAYAVTRTVRSVPAWYATLVNAYILLNCYFLLLGFVFFSNRLAAYSWLLTPLLLWVPFLTYQGRGRAILRTSLLAVFVMWGIYFGSFTVLTAR